MPVSLLFFAVTAILFLFQLLPITGALLMFLMAPFWSIFLVNAGFIGIAVEVIRGLVRPYWLLAPALWFGGYAAAKIMAERNIEKLERSFVAETRLPGAGFDPAKDSLLVENRHYSTWFIAPELVHGYAIRTVFHSDRNTADRNIVAISLGTPETCAALRQDFQRNAQNSTYIVTRDGRSVLDAPPGPCTYSHILPTPKAPFRVSAARSEGTMGMTPFERFDITVTAPDGRRARKTTLRLTRLSMLPMPVIGCALVSAGPSWTCFARFLSRNTIQLGGAGLDKRDPIDRQKALPFVIAALELKPSAYEGRFTPLSVPNAR